MCRFNVLQKTSHKKISRRGRAVTATKRTKKQDHARLLINQITFSTLSSPSPSSSLNLSLFTDTWRNVVNGRLVLVSILDKLLRYLQYYNGFWLAILNVSRNNQAFCISWSRDQLSVSTKTVRFWKILLERAEILNLGTVKLSLIGHLSISLNLLPIFTVNLTSV